MAGSPDPETGPSNTVPAGSLISVTDMRRTALLFLVIVAGLTAVVFWLTNRTTDDVPLDTSVAVADAMGNADTTGYARADRAGPGASVGA